MDRILAVICGAALVACGSGGADSDDGSGAGGAGGATPGADSGTPPVTECFGRALPPRAVEPAAPFESSLEGYVPTDSWREASPADVGMDESRLAAAVDLSLPGSNTQGIVVVRGGYIVAEKYFDGYPPEQRHESFSVAKSFTSVLVGIAIEQGFLSGTDERICEYYDEWSCDASDPHSEITIAHAMNIETGLEWSEDWRTTASPLENDTILSAGNTLDYTLGRDVVDPPGSRTRYSTGDPALLSGVLEGATGKGAQAYGLEVLFGPLGMPEIEWSQDARGRTNTYAGLQATVREFAKLGLLVLRDGVWGDRQIVPATWIERTTQPDDVCNDQYRYLWHVNMPLRLGRPDPSCPEIVGCPPLDFANLPHDAFFALGVQGQLVAVVPSADLVIARIAEGGFFASEQWDAYTRALVEGVLDAID